MSSSSGGLQKKTALFLSYACAYLKAYTSSRYYTQACWQSSTAIVSSVPLYFRSKMDLYCHDKKFPKMSVATKGLTADCRHCADQVRRRAFIGALERANTPFDQKLIQLLRKKNLKWLLKTVRTMPTMIWVEKGTRTEALKQSKMKCPVASSMKCPAASSTYIPDKSTTSSSGRVAGLCTSQFDE